MQLSSFQLTKDLVVYYSTFNSVNLPMSSDGVSISVSGSASTCSFGGAHFSPTTIHYISDLKLTH
jgi:hypothetical protein